MKITTWNVNSLTARLQHVLDWLAANPVDVLCLQELKMTDDKFPLDVLKAAGYEAAAFGQADLDRLSLARTAMLRKCENRRGNSKLAELVGLFVASPLVTVQLAAARLHVTPQAVEAMLQQLGGSLPRELTGRKRYRAWGIL